MKSWSIFRRSIKFALLSEFDKVFSKCIGTNLEKTVKEKGKEIEKFFLKNTFAECPRVRTRQSIVFVECLIGLTLGKDF